jgi:molybdopterin molybdotransferase
MMSVAQAKSILVEQVKPMSKTIWRKASDCCGYRLADAIVAPISLPPFDQSNVDGYALGSPTGQDAKLLPGEIKAGDTYTGSLGPGESIRVFTGALVPEGAFCVLMQELVTRGENSISWATDQTKPGMHIRKKGAQIQLGEQALDIGAWIGPATIGFLHALGLDEVCVYVKPVISLLITGNELQPAGSPLKPGMNYESSSAALKAVIDSMGLHVSSCRFVKDDKIELRLAVDQALEEADIVLVSGGVSVGDYDFVREVLQENNTETLFYKIAQKPGKPLYFGKNKNTFVVGLPGNPASSLTCFYEYVYPVLRLLEGKKNPFLPVKHLAAAGPYTGGTALAQFIRASVVGQEVVFLEGQESFKMRSFSGAGAFVYLPAGQAEVKKGDLVEVHLLPELA